MQRKPRSRDIATSGFKQAHVHVEMLVASSTTVPQKEMAKAPTKQMANDDVNAIVNVQKARHLQHNLQVRKTTEGGNSPRLFASSYKREHARGKRIVSILYVSTSRRDIAKTLQYVHYYRPASTTFDVFRPQVPNEMKLKGKVTESKSTTADVSLSKPTGDPEHQIH